MGKYGPYVERGEEKGNVGEDVAPDELDLAMAEALLAAPSGDRVLGRASRVGAGDRGEVRAVRAVRDRGAARGRAEVGQAADGLAAERDVAGHPDARGRAADHDAAAGRRRGPRGPRDHGGERAVRAVHRADGRRQGRLPLAGRPRTSCSRVTLDEALALYAAPKQRRGQGRAAEPLREIGVDPASGGAITLREGRFGPYVTDGETNASLRKGDDPATITLERAAELLADRRAAGPPVKRTAKKAAAKKSPAKKARGEEDAREEAAASAPAKSPRQPSERGPRTAVPAAGTSSAQP